MRQHEPHREAPRSGLNELRVTDQLRMAKARITVRPVDEDVEYTGPIIWTDMNNIAIRVGDRIKVFLKANIQHWDYAANA